MSSTSPPRFTLVSAVYGVAAYLPDFIASIEAQTFDLRRVQVVMVDDGSTDGSPALLREWQQRRPDLVEVVTQANAGLSGARNSGLREARGEWVSFPDPDDVLDPAYLETVDAFLDAHAETDLVATNRVVWREDTGELSDTHPLRPMFRRDRLVDLDQDSGFFHGSAPAAFFPLARVQAMGLKFDSRVRANFEDGHFTSAYLLAQEHTRVGFLGSARYHYRKRIDQTSQLGRTRTSPSRYTDVLEHGYLDTIKRALATHGHVPVWLQQYLAYELAYYFSVTDSRTSVPESLIASVSDRFHALAKEILAAIDADVLAYPAFPGHRTARHVLEHGYDDHPWHQACVVADRLDQRQRLVRVTWYFTGEPPTEEYLSDDRPATPLHAKTRSFTYCGRVLLRQRIVWLPANRAVAVMLDGRPMDVEFGAPTFPVRRVNPGMLGWQLGQRATRSPDPAHAGLPPVPTTRDGKRAQRLAARTKVQEKYRHAWVLMDRIGDAGDSAEILFRHLREHNPGINAWFVVGKDSPDWERLRADGYADRMVAHGSLRWRLLMAHALHLVSSHADEAVVHPPAILEFTRPRWQFTFLQHGVIKDDLSAWLDRKPIDLFITSTTQEHASIAGDDTPYGFTTREVKLTGLPRFDRLVEVGRRHPPEKRDLLLVVPTWRKGLATEPEPGTQQRRFDDDVLGSDFVRNWTAFLADPRLAELARAHGLTVGFLPHPILQPLLPAMDLPDHVQPLGYDGDVQEFFARAKVFVTDFSSVAFNAAYLERPVVYYQFDEEQVLGGAHVGRRGYFDYRRDGFGPVTTTHDAALEAVDRALADGPQPALAYLSRIEDTFPHRDGGCSARVVRAIRRSARNRSDDAPEPTPTTPALRADLEETAR